jgi:hypothetical protein
MSGVLGYNKSSSTFTKRVLGSSDDVTPDGVIAKRFFNYANLFSTGGPGGADYTFQQLSGLANETPLIFNVLVGYKTSKNDDGHWVTEQETSSSHPIGSLNC